MRVFIHAILVLSFFGAAAAQASLIPPEAAVKHAPRPHAKAPARAAVPAPRPPEKAAAKKSSEDDVLEAVDADETLPLPKYPAGARTSVGKMQVYEVDEEDTLLDVARHFRLGFIEARAANPDVDPWTPVPGESVVIPGFHLLPRTAQKGIVVNLAQMRMYYFREAGKAPETFPIGVGREGLQTPTGETTIVRKNANPVWFPTERMREEKPFLPAAVPAGPSNPLGTHALYLGWPTFLIHGSNKPWAIGRRVSSGCMRMYPEDIRDVFDMVPVGTKVTIVDQPILVGWVGDELYLEANPSRSQGNDIEISGTHESKPLTEALKKVILEASGAKPEQIDWSAVADAVEDRRGYPVVIANAKKAVAEKKEPPPASSKKEYVYTYHRD